MSFIAGGYLYISASNLLVDEFLNNTYMKWLKFFLLVIGLLLVSGLVIAEKGVENNF